MAIRIASVGLFFSVFVLAAGTTARSFAQPKKADTPRVLNPNLVMGHQQCIDCHPAEVRSWRQSKHGGGAFNTLLTNPNARKYAENMGVPLEKMATNSLCTDCHATPQRRPGRLEVRAIAAVSCESCHGAAGGDNGWLNVHAAYGPRGTRREEETPEHYAQRQATCGKRGQLGHVNLYGMAKQCLQCHLIQDEKLVSNGGHKSGNPAFELVEWCSGDVRHNTHVNQRENAQVSSLWMDPLWRKDKRRGTAAERKRVMYVVGLLVDVEVSLQTRALAKTPGFASASAGRVAASNGKLTGLNAALNLDELKTVMDEVAKVLPKLFIPPADDQKEELLAAAEAVGKVARSFADNHDGSDLAAIDGMVPTGAKGNVFEP